MQKIFVIMAVGFVMQAMSTGLARASLILSSNRTIDISALGFNGVGGAAFDETTGNLWISDSGPATNAVVEIDPLSVELDIVSAFSASVVPGLTQGPDAMALHPVTGNLYLFSSFMKNDRTGQVTQGGTFIPGFDGPENVGGAGFSASGDLLVMDQGNGTIRKLNPTTGAVQETIPLIGFSNRIGAADFDPLTGNLIAYSTNTRELLEIVPSTGQILSTTDVSQFLVLPSFPTGLAFNSSGDLLYLASGQNAGGDRLEVLNRVIPEPRSSLLVCTAAISLLLMRNRRNIAPTR
ncbi:MAG: hypothetical protein MI923_11600 [Phycisphaerales bacterium]|nr:hypothetical protein [Phycisphaerales bacterium]